MEGILTPAEAKSVPLSRRPIKRYGQVLRGLAELESSSGVHIARIRTLMPFSRETLVLAASGVESALENGLTEVDLPTEFDIKIASIVNGE
ncbi:MAG TPA: hypothetical protein VFT49_02975 [Candidatus Saccharimonadales bacterium]|nr:hypothetical protein [Candidatus Saccharimonadales bacterium]